ncbi:hypothetical protein EJV47_09970 [Hymenobacter gummosus]|uniref:DUF4377 domain-containing protein n=1 Tax=Hymenobacter gummosus TaxID=1776032 RepID=A0A3S0JFD9_9BACT|nr:hypothetical protein [Hymenobacter gummosus]RTQ50930.1 hypothetical protein EJV47_09970 [Hymenobacter gummosus]
MTMRLIPACLLAAGLLLPLAACQDDDTPKAQCVEATVVGRHCSNSSGSYGFVLSLSQPNGNAQGWVDSVGNQYSYAVTALNLPATLRRPGQRVYLLAHQATPDEISAAGPRTTQCAAPPPLVTLEVVQSTPCN